MVERNLLVSTFLSAVLGARVMVERNLLASTFLK
jgi:hypothetical protein